MQSENRNQWSTAKVILLCLLVSALAFYGGSRFDLLRVSSAQVSTAVPPAQPETPKVDPTRSERLPQYFGVTEVTEGDVLKLNDGTEVNLIGVSCPRLDDSDPRQVALAHEAIAFTKGAIAGREVRLEYEPAHSFDAQGRTLAYVYSRDGSFLNAELIKHGYGSAFARFTYKYLDDFHKYELAARKDQLGRWETRETETADDISYQASTSDLMTGSDTAKGEEPLAANSPAPQRPRVSVPIILPTPAPSEYNVTSQEPYSSTSDKPARSYGSTSYFPPSIAPATKPIVAENGSYYGEISERTGRPKTVYVRNYTRSDGTYVRSHFRSAPRR
jgi:endonuclease YncB( thermonuclease family)